jgi:probable HAF family extracellular repeat protein
MTRRPRLQIEALEDRSVPALYAAADTALDLAHDVNQAGQVVGTYSDSASETHAFLWDRGTAYDLGTLGGTSSYATGINDLGQVVGQSFLPGDQNYHAFLITPENGVWFRDNNLDGRNDLMVDLGDLGGISAGSPSWATDINNAGQVVGETWLVPYWGDEIINQVFIWDAANGMRAVGEPDSYLPTYDPSINEAGQVVGMAASGPWTAFLWDINQGMTYLGAGPGHTYSQATGINDAGQVIGVHWGGTTPSGFLWTPESPNAVTGNFTDLAENFSPDDINNSGQVVGSSGLNAVLWDPDDGLVYLFDHLAPGSGISALWRAEAINDGGAIVANGYFVVGTTSIQRGFLLTPEAPGVPSLRIADAPSVTEGNAGTRSATFTVTLSAPGTETITVAYSTSNGTATAGNDYQAQSGTLSFAPGEMSKTITVLVSGDWVAEPSETFVVNLSSPTNASISDGQGTGTILDDEPRMSINDVTVTEGNTGAVNATFTVSLSVAYDVAVTVHYQTANGSATAGSDYAAASGDVTIAAGQTTTTFTVAVLGDRSAEPTENFFVNLSAATNGLIVDSQGVGAILDNEPRISISDVTKAEGKKNQTALFTFTVTLSAAYDQAVTMSFATANGTAKTSDNDYVAKTGTLTFAPGETTKTLTIEVKGDSKREANETFYLDLFGLGSNALFAKHRGLGTILNDD